MSYIVYDCPICGSKGTNFDVTASNDISDRNVYHEWEEVEHNLAPDERGRQCELFAICRDCKHAIIFRADASYIYEEQRFTTEDEPMEINGFLNRLFEIAVLHNNVNEIFIDVGKKFNFFKAISEIFSKATKEILIVDPYLDDKILTKYAESVTKGITIKLLSSKNKNIKPAFEAWVKQYGNERPIELRIAPKLLHDRLVIVDNKSAWILSQSFKDFSDRAYGNIMQSQDPALKINACNDIWNNAQIIKP